MTRPLFTRFDTAFWSAALDYRHAHPHEHMAIPYRMVVDILLDNLLDDERMALRLLEAKNPGRFDWGEDQLERAQEWDDLHGTDDAV